MPNTTVYCSKKISLETTASLTRTMVIITVLIQIQQATVYLHISNKTEGMWTGRTFTLSGMVCSFSRLVILPCVYAVPVFVMTHMTEVFCPNVSLMSSSAHENNNLPCFIQHLQAVSSLGKGVCSKVQC